VGDRRIDDLLLALQGAFTKRGWHGPTVLESVARITPAQARKRLDGARNSVHELVDHIAYCEAEGLDYIRRGRPPEQPDGGWHRPNTSFATSLQHMKRTHQSLVRSVSRLKDQDLDRKCQTHTSGRMSLGQVLHGIAAHDAYHAGQIRLLLTLQRRRA
jgi:uncharacterized damage-inducible protein DinB